MIRRDKYGCAYFILLAVFRIPGHAQGPNSWTTGADMPTASLLPAIGVIGGKVYAVGGADSNNADININQIYDPAADRWSTGAPMPTPRYGAAGAVINNIVYVIGGKLNGNQLKAVEAYDPSTDTWSTNYSPMPTAKDSIHAVVNNGIIYIVGGFNNGGGRLSNVESYNPATDTWSEVAPLHVGKSEVALGLVGSTVVAAGGLTNSGVTSDNEEYNVSSNSWKTLTPDPTARQASCVGTIAGQLYVAGGSNNSGPVNVAESYNLAGNHWTTLAPMPQATNGPGGAVAGNLLYCFGGAITGTGAQGSTRSAKVWIYHPGPAPQPAISAGGVVSASAFGAFTSVAPGSWIEIYGSNLAPDTQSWAEFFRGINAPTSVDGTSVTVGGQPAFIDFVSPGQVNAQVPFDVGTGPQQITLQTPAGNSAPIDITVNATEPGLLAPPSFKLAGTQYAGALFVDNAYVLPDGAISGLNSRPAKPGDTVIFYGVGFGPVTPSIPAGQVVQEANRLVSKFEISIGGMPATANYDGLAPGSIGLYQFNVVVPTIGNTDAAPVTFTLDGVPGTQTLYIPVQN